MTGTKQSERANPENNESLQSFKGVNQRHLYFERALGEMRAPQNQFQDPIKAIRAPRWPDRLHQGLTKSSKGLIVLLKVLRPQTNPRDPHIKHITAELQQHQPFTQPFKGQGEGGGVEKGLQDPKCLSKKHTSWACTVSAGSLSIPWKLLVHGSIVAPDIQEKRGLGLGQFYLGL